MSTTARTPSNTTARTTAQARAARESRRAPARPVTDRNGDALLGEYDRSEAYPALSSRNLDRRESRDAERRILGGGRPTDAGALSLRRQDGSDLSGNVNDGNFNRVTTPPGVAGAARAAQADAEIDAVLTALRLSDRDRRAVEMRLEGRSLSEIAAEFGTRKQNVDRWLGGVGRRLFLFWLEDESYGAASVYRAEGVRSVNRALSGGASPVPAVVCDCASHQFRVQRVKGQPGEHTWHCEHCGKKRTREEFAALSGGVAAGD